MDNPPYVWFHSSCADSLSGLPLVADQQFMTFM